MGVAMVREICPLWSMASGPRGHVSSHGKLKA